MSNKEGKKTAGLSKITIGATVLIGLLLVILPISSTHGQTTAYAVGNEQSQDNGHGKSSNENSANQTGMRNETSSSMPGAMGEEHRQYGNSTAAMNNEGKEHPKAEQKRMEYASETAKERHDEHLAMHIPVTGPYTANMNYTFTATGTATSVSDNSTSSNASLSLDLSVWKSNKGLVSMDIMNGTVTVGNQTMPIHNGHAYYILSNHQFRVLGFITDTHSANNGNGNQTSSLSIQVIKLTSSADKNEQNVLPTSSSGGALKISTVSPQSKLASKWFLKMDGEVKMG